MLHNYKLLSICFLLLFTGCGKPSMVTVKGKVNYNGKPLAGCKVAFSPDMDMADFNPERHGYGFAVTDENGNFEVQHPDGTKGIFPGKYKVTFVCWVDSKGERVPFDAKPSEYPGGLKNLVPSIYESLSDTPERLTVPSAGTEVTFELKG